MHEDYCVAGMFCSACLCVYGTGPYNQDFSLGMGGGGGESDLDTFRRTLNFNSSFRCNEGVMFSELIAMITSLSRK